MRWRAGGRVPASIVLPPLWRRHRGAAVLVAALALFLLGERVALGPRAESDSDRYHDRTFRVVRVVDGDTLDLGFADGEGSTTRVRLWGVDTPELAHGGQLEMHFGRQAADFAERTCGDRHVHVVLSPSRTRDKYGRLLAYLLLERGGPMFNEMLVEQGFAYADTRFDHPYKKQFEVAERRAQRAKTGLWESVTLSQMPEWRQRREQSAAAKDR